MPADEWTRNVVLTIFVFLLGVMVTVIGAWVKLNGSSINRRFGALEDRIDGHIDSCEKIPKGELVLEIRSLQKEQEKMRTVMHWFGNCLIIMATKLDVSIPDRPQV